MSFSIYQASVPIYVKLLAGQVNMIEKAVADAETRKFTLPLQSQLRHCETEPKGNTRIDHIMRKKHDDRQGQASATITGQFSSTFSTAAVN